MPAVKTRLNVLKTFLSSRLHDLCCEIHWVYNAFTGRRDQSFSSCWPGQLHLQRRVGVTVSWRQAQWDRLRLLCGALSRRHVQHCHTTSHALLPVQRHLSMSLADSSQPGRILAAARLRWEDNARYYRASGVLGLHANDRGEYAGNVGVCPAHGCVIVHFLVVTWRSHFSFVLKCS